MRLLPGKPKRRVGTISGPQPIHIGGGMAVSHRPALATSIIRLALVATTQA